MSLTEEELRELAERVPEESEEPATEGKRWQCPSCSNSYTDSSSLRRHRREVHGWKGTTARRRRGRSAQAAAVPAGEPDDPEAVVAEAVDHTRGLASLFYVVAPYLAVTLAGAEDEAGNVIVRSRAQVAGELLLPIARRDVRVLAWLVRFNGAFRGGAAFNMVASVGAAAVVDATAISAMVAGGDPREAAAMATEAGVKVGPVTMQPIKMAIPDVIEFMAKQEPPPAASAASPNGEEKRGRRQKEPEVIEGGVVDT